MKTTRVNVIVPRELKVALIRACLATKTSLIAEVTLSLLEEYQPDGYKQLALEVRARAAQRNKRPRVDEKKDGQTLSLELPVELKTSISNRAMSNYRSIGGELRQFLTRRYKRWTTP